MLAGADLLDIDCLCQLVVYVDILPQQATLSGGNIMKEQGSLEELEIKTGIMWDPASFEWVERFAEMCFLPRTIFASLVLWFFFQLPSWAMGF